MEFMNSPSRRRFSLLMLTLTFLTVSFNGGSIARAQDWQDGFNLFHLLLEQEGLSTSTDIPNAIRGDATKKVVVLLGDVNSNRQWSWRNLRTFIHSGGAVLVATDQDTNMDGIGAISGGPVKVTAAFSAYQDFDDCPIVKLFSKTHPLSKDLSEVIANRSGWISQRISNGTKWSTIAQLPKGTRSPGNRRADAPLISVMTSQRNPAGKMIVMADHSILLNGMLTHGDNALLAVNIADFLCDRNREELYVVVDGQALGAKLPQMMPEIRPEDVPPLTMEDIANMPRGQLLNFANTLMTELEDADVHNELLANQPADVEPGFYRRCIFLALACLGAGFLIRQIPKGARNSEPSIRREPATVSDIRINELVYAGNLLPAARELARDFFRTVTRSSDIADWQIRPQEVQIEGGVFHQRSVRRDLFRLHRLATRVDRSYISQREFQRLATKIERLHVLHRSGRLIHPWFINVE
jgi:hypothetical protein